MSTSSLAGRVDSKASSETQGRSVGPGEKVGQKFSGTGGKAPGYRLTGPFPNGQANAGS